MLRLGRPSETGQRVVLDSQLAALYGVTTKRLNEQVRRNQARFPQDFVFQLTKVEATGLRSQFATSKHQSRGGRRYLPCVFTEHGALMAASVLNSPKAIEMSIFVMRAFVGLRNLLSTHRELTTKLQELEQRCTQHDKQIVILFDAIRKLIEPVVPPKRRIGFGAEDYERVQARALSR